MSFTVNDKVAGATIEAVAGETYKIKAEVWSQMPIDRLEIIGNGELVAEVSIGAAEFHKIIEIDYQTNQSVWLTARAYQLTNRDTRNGLSLSQRRNEGGGPTQLNRYYGTLRPEVTFSHTSPIYLEVDGEPTKSTTDANYFVQYLQNVIDWLDKSGSFPTEDAKQEVLEAFEQGKQGFEDLAAGT